MIRRLEIKIRYHSTHQLSAYKQTSNKSKFQSPLFNFKRGKLRWNYLEGGSRQSHSKVFCLLQAQFCLTGSIRSEHTWCPAAYTQQLYLHDEICFIIIIQPEQQNCTARIPGSRSQTINYSWMGAQRTMMMILDTFSSITFSFCLFSKVTVQVIGKSYKFHQLPGEVILL